MSTLLRFLGLASEQPASGEGETETVRRIAARLDRLEASVAKYLAAFAYVLARVAHADLEIDAAETATMEAVVARIGGLDGEQAALAVAIAQSQARNLGGTENYVVTREFRKISSPEQRRQLLECLYAVAAADGSISTLESQEIANVAEELGLTRAEANALRAHYREQLAVLRPGASERRGDR